MVLQHQLGSLALENWQVFRDPIEAPSIVTGFPRPRSLARLASRMQLRLGELPARGDCDRDSKSVRAYSERQRNGFVRPSKLRDGFVGPPNFLTYMSTVQDIRRGAERAIMSHVLPNKRRISTSFLSLRRPKHNSDRPCQAAQSRSYVKSSSHVQSFARRGSTADETI